MFFRQLGRANNKKILMIHGLLGSSKDFTQLCLPLKEEFNLFLIDLPGHGNSVYTKKLTKEKLLKEILAFIKRHSIEMAIGYSLGGRLLLELDYYNRDLLKKIGILSSHPGYDRAELKTLPDLTSHWIHQIRLNPKSFLKNWYSQELFKTLDTKKMVQLRSDFNQEAVIWMLKALNIRYQIDCTIHIKNEKKKFFFICGKEDTKYCSLYDKLSHKHIVENASHAVFLEKPEECAQILKHHFFS